MRQHRGARTTRVTGKVDIRGIFDRLGDWFAMLGWVVKLPFRLIGAIAGVFAAVGRGLLRWTIQLCFGFIGFAFIAFVGFALVRVIFHPLFV
jgi:hypothetical protein